MSNRDRIKQKVANAKHQRKPEEAVVVRDANGNWIFEVYMPQHSVQDNRMRRLS